MSEEHTFCRDCGSNAWWFEEAGRMVHEDFYVDDALWHATCPDDGVICIGCFEQRLGRRLTRRDFTTPARTHTAPWPGPGTPPSRRFVDRWQTFDEQLEPFSGEEAPASDEREVAAVNYCRICEQDFASVEAFDYHLPPARLSPRQARLVNADASDLAAWGLVRDRRGRWTNHLPGSFGTRERLGLKPRSHIWPARLRDAGLA